MFKPFQLTEINYANDKKNAVYGLNTINQKKEENEFKANYDYLKEGNNQNTMKIKSKNNKSNFLPPEAKKCVRHSAERTRKINDNGYNNTIYSNTNKGKNFNISYNMSSKTNKNKYNSLDKKGIKNNYNKYDKFVNTGYGKTTKTSKNQPKNISFNRTFFKNDE